MQLLLHMGKKLINNIYILKSQTGTGKTYTMEGFFRNESQRGIIPRATDEIFECTNFRYSVLTLL
jgi:hypothetical protein